MYDFSQVLAVKNGKGGNLGTVAINSRQPGAVQSFLANLSLSNLMAKLRIPTTFAQTKTDEFDGSQVITMDRDGNTIWRFEIDQSSIGSHRHYFNMANYSLKTVEINPPTDGVDYAKGNSEYEFFVTGGDNGGVWLVTENAPSGTTEDSFLIRGVELKEKTGTDVRFTDMFRDLGTDRLRFNLRVRFEYKGGTTTVGAAQLNDETLEGAENIVNNQDTNSGQTDGTTPPKVLQATWPIEIYALDTVPAEDDPDDNPSTAGLTRFNVVYDPIVLEIETPNCGGGSLLKNGVADVFKNLMCKTVMGLINGMKTALNWIADRFLTIDPLGHAGSDTVIKYWNVIRNLVNSLAVLILLIAGVAIMLQYEPTTYNLQSVLRKLIIAIVLVNFSILVIQLAIDVANVVAMGGYFMLNQAFENDSSGLSNASSAIGALTAAITTMIVAAAASGFSGFLAIIIFVFAILILLIYVTYKIAVQYYFRLVALWICVILAPAAFAARVLPGTASYFGKWKNILVGTLVAQLALSLMLGLSLAMIVAVKTTGSGTEAFLAVIASFVLLYMSTKVPNKAAAMMGSDLAGSLETKAIAGLKASGTKLQQFRANRVRNRELGDARAQTLGVAGESWLTKQKAFRRDDVARFRNKYVNKDMALYGVNREEASKLSGEAYDQAYEELEKKSKRENKAAYDAADAAEYEKKIKDEHSHVEDKLLRLNRKDVFDDMDKEERQKGQIRLDQSWGAGGRRRRLGNEAGRENAEIRRARNSALTYRGSSFIGTADYNDAIKRYLDYDAVNRGEREDAIDAMIAHMGTVDTKDEYAAKHQTFSWTNRATGDTGWKGFWESVGAPRGFVTNGRAMDAADQLMFEMVPENMAETNGAQYRDLYADLSKARKDARRTGQFNLQYAGPPAPPTPPVAAPAVVAYSPQATAWATRSGSPALNTPPAGGIPTGVNPATVSADLARVAALAHTAGTGTILTPAEQSEYSSAYQRLVNAGYRP